MTFTKCQKGGVLMAKIVLVEQDKVSIGMDDGAIKEVRT